MESSSSSSEVYLTFNPESSFPMQCGAGSTTSLTFGFLMGKAGTEALTERGAVRPGDCTQCPGQHWGRRGPVVTATVTADKQELGLGFNVYTSRALTCTIISSKHSMTEYFL